MAVFTRTTVCLLSPKAFAATTENALDKMVAQSVRIRAAPPKVDPLGVYTEQLFDVAETLRTGSAAGGRQRTIAHEV